MRVFPILLALNIAAVVHAQDQPATVTKACRAVEGIVVPTASQPGGSCSPDNLYYGIKGARDYGAARRCALAKRQDLERPLSDLDVEGLIPTATLAMIYANGNGVPRNIDLAIRLVCVDDPPSDNWLPLDDLITELLKLKTVQTRPFDFCSDMPEIGRSLDDYCAAIGYALDEKKHMVPLNNLMSSWTPVQRMSYNKMMAAHDAFVGIEQKAEAIDGTGVGGSMMSVQHHLRIKQIDALVRFESGQFPNFTHQDYLAADKALNVEYTKFIAGLAAQYQPDGDTMPPRTLRDAERAWTAYRDAWVQFAQRRWPKVTADSWLTLLTRERSNQLGTVEDY